MSARGPRPYGPGRRQFLTGGTPLTPLSPMRRREAVVHGALHTAVFSAGALQQGEGIGSELERATAVLVVAVVVVVVVGKYGRPAGRHAGRHAGQPAGRPAGGRRPTDAHERKKKKKHKTTQKKII